MLNNHKNYARTLYIIDNLSTFADDYSFDQ